MLGNWDWFKILWVGFYRNPFCTSQSNFSLLEREREREREKEKAKGKAQKVYVWVRAVAIFPTCRFHEADWVRFSHLKLFYFPTCRFHEEVEQVCLWYFNCSTRVSKVWSYPITSFRCKKMRKIRLFESFIY